jgi:bleomycin hydrolase
MRRTALLAFLILFSAAIFAQQMPPKDKGFFKEYQPGYYQCCVLKGIEDFGKTADSVKPPDKRFKVDLTGKDIPTSVDQFTKYWYQPPISQGNTGTCWCFSTTSFFESEVYRLTKKQVKLSEMYTVYWEYVERAKGVVKSRGAIEIGDGSEANAVNRIWSIYGIIPESDYNGMLPGQTVYDHTKMFNELDTYLKSVKANSAWNEEIVIATVKSILNSYMGVPPTKVKVDGKEMTPQEYLKNELKLNLDDYVDVMSLMEKPYYKQVEYVVPDNWWHSKDYYNVPLDDFMSIVKNALKNGYTVAVGGDVSEAGFEPTTQTAIIPTFDIPAEYIDESARQFRFSNGSTTDDHGLHIVGYYVKNGTTWFLVKDSGASSRNAGKGSKNFGFYFFREDYVKLKMMDFMVHKDAMKDVLQKFK